MEIKIKIDQSVIDALHYSIGKISEVLPDNFEEILDSISNISVEVPSLKEIHQIEKKQMIALLRISELFK